MKQININRSMAKISRILGVDFTLEHIEDNTFLISSKEIEISDTINFDNSVIVKDDVLKTNRKDIDLYDVLYDLCNAYINGE